MKQNCIERMESIGAAQKIAMFNFKQQESYEFKKAYATTRAHEFVTECAKRDLNCHVSVGGLDSITLYLFLKSIGVYAEGISVSSLEDRSIQEVHKQLGLTIIKPYMSKVEVLQRFGFPVLSKETAGKIELLQNPTPKNTTVRHAIITGETGKYGGNRTGTRMRMSQKWLDKFGGYENETEGVDYAIPDFRVSAKCCYYLKEKPCDDWAKLNKSVPFLGLMASEGGRREKSLKINGCNFFGKTTIRSAPFAIFNRQDLLQLALELGVPVPTIYGEIKTDENGLLQTSGAQRTGCSMCGFGIHLEKRPHRFDRLREVNPLEWEFWMYNCCTDDAGNKYGWGKVLDYIGVGWRAPLPVYCAFEQMSLFV